MKILHVSVQGVQAFFAALDWKNEKTHQHHSLNWDSNWVLLFFSACLNEQTQ